MFESCANCGARIVAGAIRDDRGVYCSPECRGYAMYPGFCPTCLSLTSAEPAGDCLTFYGVGIDLRGKRDVCPTCGSIETSRWFTVFWVPIVPLGRYRIRYTKPHASLSRRVEHPDNPKLDRLPNTNRCWNCAYPVPDGRGACPSCGRPVDDNTA
jgi:RNA polymerase subunit RPABC4/transcription elongation factor Spt4